MMLGYKKLMRWLSLLLATASKDTNTFPLMHASIRRGMFLETIGADEHQTELRDELFITGAFSLLESDHRGPFTAPVRTDFALGNDRDAIVRRTGPYAPYLTLIEAIERSDPIGSATRPIRCVADRCLQRSAAEVDDIAELLDAEI